MKKTISLILAVMLTLTLCATAVSAAGVGTITINGLGADTKYDIYKLLDLTTYDKTSAAYSYKVNPVWDEFFATDAAKVYFSVDEQDYATWINAHEDDATVAAFAKLAMDWAKAHPAITPDKSSENPGDLAVTGTTGVFSGLDLGYYLVDSTMGALCGLTTTNPNASINAKNGVPTIDKQVKEDSTGNFGDSNTADIGQIVEYRVTINVHAGAEAYVLKDVLAAGLTFQALGEMKHVIPGLESHPITADKYTFTKTDDQHFTIAFTQAFCDSLKTNDKIEIHYTAMVNRNAVIAGLGNSNTVTLEFGEGKTTPPDTVETFTYGFDLIKTNGQYDLIDGAEFRIYDAATGGNEVKVVLMDNPADGYRRAREDETGVNIVVTDGKVRVRGFDNGTYYLEEKVTPAGYNQLAGRQEFIISDGNLDAVFNDGVYSTGSGVHVVNKSGSMLPETGGMGTVLFVTFGAIMVLGTGVLLVTKKRMAMIED